MLTADLVRARRRGDELKLQPLDPEAKVRAVGFAAEHSAILRAHVGRTRGEIDQAFGAMRCAAKDRKLLLAVRKLCLDRCEFEASPEIDPSDLRRDLFLRAAAARRDGSFDRDALIAALAEERSTTPNEIEATMFADLKDGHRLVKLEPISPDLLVAGMDAAQLQAAILRATKVIAKVRSASPDRYRALFRALKFRRLLFELRTDGPGYRLELDGPMSLFSASTKYGLALALALPAIMACDEWSIEADLRWGKERKPLTLRAAGKATGVLETGQLPEEIDVLIAKLTSEDLGLRAEPSADILDLPGVGLVVPDVRFTDIATGEIAYLEVLGFWSRAAVWKRVELVQAGLRDRIVFAVPERLRVSEAVLDEQLPASLYVFKKTIVPREIATRVHALFERGGQP